MSALAQYEAIRLFVERAAAVLPGFTVTNANAPALAQVCARLDGIPLAIELAAARVNVLRVEQIAARLDDRFRLLTGGSRTAVPRQQTLRALIDWSYDLLTESERLLLQRLAVFAGGWTLEAAEAVCAGGSLNQDDVLDVLTQLVNKSLVVAEREQEYKRPATGCWKPFASMRWSGWRRAARRTRCGGGTPSTTWRWRRRRQPWLGRAEQDAWLDRLEVEHDNLRAALGWALAGSAVETGARIAIALAGQDWDGLWSGIGYWSEGWRWLAAVLAQRDALAPGICAWALLLAAVYRGMLDGDPFLAQTRSP